MFIDRDGSPIGYELFSGNTFDGKTLIGALTSLKKRFGVRRVIIVADRGINSKLNLQAISEAGYGYIVASRLKSMPAKVKQQALDGTGYTPLSWNTDSGEVTVSVKELPYTNIIREGHRAVGHLEEQLIITHSIKRAHKDAADRQRLLAKAERFLENPSSMKGQLKRGGRRYIKAEDTAETVFSLDQDALERDAIWDGYYAIQTSEKNLAPREIIDAYHTLWKIEESFRIMKSTLEVRPIFHWTEDRIRGHFVVCFLAFLMERRMELLLSKHEVAATPLKIREALNDMMITRITLDDTVFYVKSKTPSLGSQILRLLRVKPPATLSTEQLWRDWISGI